MKILLGVTSSIAIYKALDLCSQLKKKGHEISVIMSENAKKMVDPIPFHSITQNIVFYDQFKEKDYIPHISLADWADIFVVAPATANILGKMANGIADDLLSTTYTAFEKTVIVAPAMNVKMYAHAAVQKNMNTLKSFGVNFVEPATGMLACGYEGKGKLAPVSEILEAIEFYEDNKVSLSGKKVIVSAGGTIEDIDPVRFITNRSTGKMGIAFAKTASLMGADVTLVYGNIQGEPPQNIKTIYTRSAHEMLDSLEKLMKDADILVMSAAVADYRLEQKSDKKIKKNEDNLTLNLVKNPDILKNLSKNKKQNQIYIGFALETNDLVENATRKMKEKKMDLIIANQPENFGSEKGSVLILSPNGEKEEIKSANKNLIAKKILEKISKSL